MLLNKCCYWHGLIHAADRTDPLKMKGLEKLIKSFERMILLQCINERGFSDNAIVRRADEDTSKIVVAFKKQNVTLRMQSCSIDDRFHLKALTKTER